MPNQELIYLLKGDIDKVERNYKKTLGIQLKKVFKVFKCL